MSLYLHRAVLALLAASLLPSVFGASAGDRPRLVVLTDYFKDPDDKQSMIRLLIYANEFEIEGLIATSLAFGDGSVRPELLHEIIGDYAKVFPSLRQHARPGHEYPTPESLTRLVKAGAPVVRTRVGNGKGFAVSYPRGERDSRACEPAETWIGAGRDSAASNHLIHVIDRDDPRPVWIAVWGGPMDLAQALWKVRHERPAAALAHFVGKIRLYQISWQDSGAVWLWENFPELFRLQTTVMPHGMYAEGPAELRDGAWVEANITTGHGPLGAGYPSANASGKTAVNVKEGDTPSFLHLLAPGLSDPEQPTWGGWGGRFQRFDDRTPRFVDGRDRHPASTDPRRETGWTIARWYGAIANEFAARMDWCVQPYSAANHPPVVHLDNDPSRRVLQRTARSGDKITFSASGTTDPDGNSLTYRWWHYREPGTFASELELHQSGSPVATLVAPRVTSPATAHIILEVTDSGKPRLTSYRRIVLTLAPR